MRVALCSLKGAPGVSVAAYGIARAAEAEGHNVVLVEADASGGDLSARCGVPLQPALVRLAAEARRGASAEMVASHLEPLTERLAVLAAPPSSTQAAAALDVLARPLSEALRLVDADVVIDAGRLLPGSPVWGLVTTMDWLVVVVHPVLAHAAALRAELEALADSGCRLGVLVMDLPAASGEPVPLAELEDLVGHRATVLGEVEWDPSGERLLHSPPTPLRLARSALWRSLRTVHGALAAQVPHAGPVPSVPPTDERVPTIGAQA